MAFAIPAFVRPVAAALLLAVLPLLPAAQANSGDGAMAGTTSPDYICLVDAVATAGDWRLDIYSPFTYTRDFSTPEATVEGQCFGRPCPVGSTLSATLFRITGSKETAVASVNMPCL